MAPRPKADPVPHLHLGNAHRFMLPMPEACGALAMAASCIQDGSIEAYRNKKTGGIMLSYLCPGCDTHHPLIEVQAINEQIDDNERFLMQVRGCMPYADYLEASGNVLHQEEAAHVPSRQLIAALAGDQGRVEDTSAEDVFDNLPGLITEMMEGGATFALDTVTGCTAVGFECEDCEVIHGVLLLAMPKPKDMRSAAGYTSLGNPFLEMMMAEPGERLH